MKSYRKTIFITCWTIQISQDFLFTEHETAYISYERDKTCNGESEDSYDVPSPTFSEDNSDVWTCSTCNKDFDNMVCILYFGLPTHFV